MAEYGLLLALLALMLTGVMLGISGNLTGFFEDTTEVLKTGNTLPTGP